MNKHAHFGVPILTFECSILALSSAIDPPSRMIHVQDRVPFVTNDIEMRMPHARRARLRRRILSFFLEISKIYDEN